MLPLQFAQHTSRVVLHVQCNNTQWGDQVCAVGNSDALGNWEPEHGLTLATSNDIFPWWHGVLEVPAAADKPVEFKFVIRRPAGQYTWEEGANRRLPCGSAQEDCQLVLNFGDSAEPHIRISRAKELADWYWDSVPVVDTPQSPPLSFPANVEAFDLAEDDLFKSSSFPLKDSAPYFGRIRAREISVIV